MRYECLRMFVETVGKDELLVPSDIQVWLSASFPYRPDRSSSFSKA